MNRHGASAKTLAVKHHVREAVALGVVGLTADRVARAASFVAVLVAALGGDR